jgi:hypothetical protein
MAVAEQFHCGRSAGLTFRHGQLEAAFIGDGFAIELDDDVAGLDAGLPGRGVGGDVEGLCADPGSD